VDIADGGKTGMSKEIVLFGTGKYFENYMMCYGTEARRYPVFAVDNNADVVGSTKCGIPVREPEVLAEMDKDSFYVIICCAEYKEIAVQLEEMGIMDYQYYCPIPVEQAVPMELSADCSRQERVSVPESSDKPYKIGYVPGVFDLFHVGHLNLLRNSKSRCEYLIAGVLTDELVEHFKGRRPIIPYAQRAAIINAISYVDRVVPVDFDNTYKIDAWHRYHFDCHFSGSDHGIDWAEDIRQLREVGSNMEFFDYTQATSSTKIRGELG